MDSGSYASGRCNNDNGCSCNTDRTYFDDMPLAMAYVSWQDWNKIYEPCKGLEEGTIFPELNLPFLGRGVCKR